MSTANKKNDGFSRFKKKLRRNAWIKSLLFGVSCGLLAAAGIIIYQKMTTVSPQLLLYLPIGAGVALFTGLLAFLILRPSIKKIARRLDDELMLGEKVQTMLEYQDSQEDMLVLQREDANEKLMSKPLRSVRDRYFWLSVILPVLACAFITTAVILPVKAVEPPPPVEEEPETPFELSSWQESALLELIEQVKSSDMEAAPKAATVAELEGLLETLRVTTVEKEMKTHVIDTIRALNQIIRDHNSAVMFYKYLAVSEYEPVKGIAMSMDMISGLEAKEALNHARETLRVDDINAPMTAFISAVSEALSKIQEEGLSKEDPIYQAFLTLTAQLADIGAQADDYTRDWVQAHFDEAFTEASDEISDALYVQHINREVKNTTVKRLMEIFGISEDELPREEQVQLPSGDDEPDDEEGDEEDKGSEGGIGDMEVLYGSDDVIYDPVQNTYVKYGDVINGYYAAVSEKILVGKIPDTLQEYITNYFDTLYDGSEKETES